MPDFETLRKNLEKNGFETVYFPTGVQAADYLEQTLNGKTIGLGGSMTAKELGLSQRLAVHNQVYWHWDSATLEQAAQAQVYISSVNALAESGEIINIDGTGNRVAATLFGHEVVYLIVGSNKIAPDYEGALWRARNIAAPKNAQRLGCQTPCAVKGDRCYDCDSPARICRALSVLWRKPNGVGKVQVILVGESLGY